MAKYRGKEVKLNKPFRLSTAESKRKKFGVYVKNKSTGKIKKVTFGARGMSIKKNIPARRKSFRARHKCDEKKSKLTAGYWSCKKW